MTPDDDPEPAKEPPKAPGDLVWPGYRVERHLNRSLDADVYLVHSTRRATSCVAKCVLPWKADAPRSPKRLRNEGRLLKQLTHPNIVRCYSVKDEPTGMVLELLAGSTLQARTRAFGDLSWRELTTLGTHLVAALQFLHHAGYLHLDLKPDNVMVTPAGAKLIDLNLARPPGPGRRGVGSRYYMAPEQVAGDDLGPAADVFALGMTLYAAACCALPATGPEDHPHLHRPMRPIGERRNLPQRLGELIDACLVLDPAARPQLSDIQASLGRMSKTLDKLEARYGR